MSAVEHGFKAEVQQLLELMIHSVYSDREVFVRELVSNAADALDKVKFLELTRSDLVPAGNEVHGIRISHDKEARTVVFEDDGIGMTETEVVDHLGTIAKSGTREFLAQANVLAIWTLGFYMGFLVWARSLTPPHQPSRKGG